MFILRLILLFLIPSCFTGCGFFFARPPKRPPHGTVAVKIDAHGETRAPIYLTIFPLEKGERGPKIGTYIVKDGSVTGYTLPMGKTYEFRALVDRDGDQRLSAKEKSTSVKDVVPDPDVTAPHRPILIDLPLPPGVQAPKKKKKAESSPGLQLDPEEARLLQKGLEKLRKAAPDVPIPRSLEKFQ